MTQVNLKDVARLGTAIHVLIGGVDAQAGDSALKGAHAAVLGAQLAALCVERPDTHVVAASRHQRVAVVIQETDTLGILGSSGRSADRDTSLLQ